MKSMMVGHTELNFILVVDYFMENQSLDYSLNKCFQPNISIDNVIALK